MNRWSWHSALKVKTFRLGRVSEVEEEEYSRTEGCLGKILWLYPCLSNDLRLSTESFQLHPPFMMMYDEKKSQSKKSTLQRGCADDIPTLFIFLILQHYPYKTRIMYHIDVWQNQYNIVK